jgi:predicted dinucleotide-binding enzyme
VDQLGSHARAATAGEAAAGGDIVVVTVPLKAYRDVPVEPLVGKVVIDTNNYYPDRDGHIAERSVLPIAGNDADAKRTVIAFLDSIGYDAYDVGPLSEGWRFQRDTAAYTKPYAVPGTSYPDWTPRPLSADALAEHLAAARRYRDM